MRGKDEARSMPPLLTWLPESLTGRFLLAVLGLLAAATLAAAIARRLAAGEPTRAAVSAFAARLRGWWLMTGVFALAMLSGGVGSVLVFFCASFLLLREFVTITPTRPGDHHTLFWMFFVILPLQYVLVWLGWYGLFAVMIPVYAFLLVPIRSAVAGDPRRFMERVAKLQWALMTGVYGVSHAPALLKMELAAGGAAGPRLLLYLCTVVQAGDAAHDIVDLALHGAPVVPGLSTRRSWAGFAASSAAAALLGMALYWATPFSPWQSAGMGLLCGVLGSAGDLCLAAIRRDRGREGVVVVRTRASMLDRTISLCFAAPVFFHVLRFFWGAGELAVF